jgi:phosphatidylinositol dimannoside acyltransferase
MSAVRATDPPQPTEVHEPIETRIAAAGSGAEALAHETIRGRVVVGALDVAAWLAGHLPERPLVGLAELVGEAWYRLAPRRAAQARRNLRRVCEWAAAEGVGSAMVRRAATDPATLQRLVRSAFRHAARYYLEVARTPSITPAYIRERIHIETPEVIEAAFASTRPIIFVAPHLGSVELPGLYLSVHSGRRPVAPMETLANVSLQRWFVRTRGSVGITIVGLGAARRELLGALRRGDPVGLVADRDLTGGGIEIPFFGAPAPIPVGPALLAIEGDAQVFATSVRRVGVGRYAGRLAPVPVPTEGTRRERATGMLRAEVAAFERDILLAPDQWWAVFFPIWPDLETTDAGTRS